MNIAVIGGGIGGLTLALALNQRGIVCRVYEAASELKALGVGINLLPHAVQVLSELGLLDQLQRAGIETQELCFTTNNGQFVLREPRGRFAGYHWPQISIHRGALHQILLEAVLQRLGDSAVELGHRCAGLSQTETSVSCRFASPSDATLPEVTTDIAIACDGIHSPTRQAMHPDAKPRHPDGRRFSLYRGVSRWKPFLTGASMLYLGTRSTGRLIIYPIHKYDDGMQLISWVAAVPSKEQGEEVRDWRRTASPADFVDRFDQLVFDWLDVPGMFRAAHEAFETPYVDQDPLPYWTKGRVTLLGDAAHPMVPRGSNGAAQAIIDARTLADAVDEATDPLQGLKDYESQRRPVTSELVLANRTHSPNAILDVIEERTGGKRYANLGDVISDEEFSSWQTRYKSIAGFEMDSLNRRKVVAR